jgi:hypothetical protein
MKYWLITGNIALWSNTIAALQFRPDLFMASALFAVGMSVATIAYLMGMK